MAPGFPGDPGTGLLCSDEAAEERFSTLHSALPCPALDPETGRCDLYAARPLSCRTYGPPVRIAGEDMPPCRLCFDGAAPEEIERARVEVDPDGIEDALIAELEDQGQTFVAFALALPTQPQKKPDHPERE